MKEQVITKYDNNIRKLLRKIIDHFITISKDESNKALLYFPERKTYLEFNDSDPFIAQFCLDIPQDLNAEIISHLLDIRSEFIMEEDIEFLF